MQCTSCKITLNTAAIKAAPVIATAAVIATAVKVCCSWRIASAEGYHTKQYPLYCPALHCIVKTAELSYSTAL